MIGCWCAPLWWRCVIALKLCLGPPPTGEFLHSLTLLLFLEALTSQSVSSRKCSLPRPCTRWHSVVCGLYRTTLQLSIDLRRDTCWWMQTWGTSDDTNQDSAGTHQTKVHFLRRSIWQSLLVANSSFRGCPCVKGYFFDFLRASHSLPFNCPIHLNLIQVVIHLSLFAGIEQINWFVGLTVVVLIDSSVVVAWSAQPWKEVGGYLVYQWQGGQFVGFKSHCRRQHCWFIIHRGNAFRYR